MDIKKLLVSFVMLVSILFLAANVSAQQLADNVVVEVNGVNANSNPAIVVGDILFVRVEFDSLVNIQDVTVRAELEGTRRNVRAETNPFDVEIGNRYIRTLRLDVPFDLRDKLSGYVDLNIRISGTGYRNEENFQLRVQRESYRVDVMSVEVPQTVKAGELFPVDIVLKNLGYNDLSDLFVTAKISALNVERTSFFGNLIAIECDDDASAVDNYGINISRKCIENKADTISGRIFLSTPYNVKPGIYALEVKVSSEDTVSSQTVQVVISNQFSEGNFIVSGNQLMIANPTNELVVYRLVPQSTASLTVSVSDSIVSVPAGSSKTVSVDATSALDGVQTYTVNIFAVDGTLVESVKFSETFEGRDITSPIFILTIVLAIIFIVLLVVLIILIGKKPKKSEEFGECYY